MTADQSVAIVGGGPIGLALALHLDMYGVRSTVFNTEPETRWHPKGNIHNARTMELFRKVGIADRIRALGLPGDHPFDVAYFTRLERLRDCAGPDAVARRATSACAMRARRPTNSRSRPIASTRCMSSGFLFEEASRRPGITMRFGCDGRTTSSRTARAFRSDASERRRHGRAAPRRPTWSAATAAAAPCARRSASATRAKTTS